ncbi:SprT-like family-domain-containing protein [Cokeromyces recurvatus]|uniref:SprT-like family-domain-containing protein n=1 Tax=Cokeromyces recurvatus TaxID=90255 RepID=UPI0022207DC8|nr:SprT-like family-domain-containing protein [Cokeromyces recurvatus]KAI7907361.1 SprT-like family-domain-containing protein [Cokeromyces recurvatus]
MVEVRWSTRMSRCAGTCTFKPGGYCTIALSEPLLKFRPKSDMIETLLHEMIHAYLFITQRNTDRDGHGPEFLYEADRINKLANVNITVYHSFHTEVDYYLTHVWQCNGICQDKPPYFGIVKRSMNRPPQHADPWFDEHQRTCGGTFIKIHSPELKTKRKQKVQTNTLLNYFNDKKQRR